MAWLEYTINMHLNMKEIRKYLQLFNGQALEAADHAKYLSVDISKDLSWNTHINRITANAKKH